MHENQIVRIQNPSTTKKPDPSNRPKTREGIIQPPKSAPNQRTQFNKKNVYNVCKGKKTAHPKQ
jgi:hypothetical protein